MALGPENARAAHNNQSAIKEPVIIGTPRCPYYLDETRCTIPAGHQGAHGIAEGDRDRMTMWPNEDRYVSTNSYDDQIVLDHDGITVGGKRVPGCIVSDPQNVIVGTTDLEDHWLLTITLMTGREPQIEDGIQVTSTSTVDRVAYAIPPSDTPAPTEAPHSVREIPYDEMRALLGLPDVSNYIMRRDLDRAFHKMRKAFGGFAEVLVEAGQQFARNLESFTDALAGAQPKPTPPMWAIDPARSRRRNMR